MTDKILITGSAGFCGRAFQRYFADKDVELTLIDIKEGNDCRDYFRVVDKQFDLIIHLAATVEGREVIDGEPLRVASNLELDAACFQWIMRTEQPRLVYYSSSAAYPIDIQQTAYNLKETYLDYGHVRTPDQTYGLAKLVGEIQASLLKDEGVNVHIFRPFSGYGEDQDLTYPFPSFIDRIKNRMDPFVIWGTGTQVRDFIHIDDVVEATMLAVKLDIQEPVNLGWGRPTSFLELADLMFEAADFHPEIKCLTDKPTGVFYRCSDPSKMLEFYAPRVSLEEGIRRALAA